MNSFITNVGYLKANIKEDEQIYTSFIVIFKSNNNAETLQYYKQALL